MNAGIGLAPVLQASLPLFIQLTPHLNRRNGVSVQKKSVIYPPETYDHNY